MTQDEFYGHFMSLLAGPHGSEIAGQLLTKALSTDNVASEYIGSFLGKAIASCTDSLTRDVLTLQIHAHLSETRGGNVRETIDLANRRGHFTEKIRESLRAAMVKSESGRAAAEAIGLTLPGPEDLPS